MYPATAVRSNPWKSSARSNPRRSTSERSQRSIRHPPPQPRNSARGYGMTSATDGLPASSGAHSGLASQEIRHSGQAAFSRATAGSVWMMSPNELGLSTSSVRGISDRRKTFTSRWPSGPRDASAGRRRGSSSVRCGCRTPSGAVPRSSCPCGRSRTPTASPHRAAGRHCRC